MEILNEAPRTRDGGSWMPGSGLKARVIADKVTRYK